VIFANTLERNKLFGRKSFANKKRKILSIFTFHTEGHGKGKECIVKCSILSIKGFF